MPVCVTALEFNVVTCRSAFYFRGGSLKGKSMGVCVQEIVALNAMDSLRRHCAKREQGTGRRDVPRRTANAITAQHYP